MSAFANLYQSVLQPYRHDHATAYTLNIDVQYQVDVSIEYAMHRCDIRRFTVDAWRRLWR